ncbi:MAG TPA: hypothetical protein VKU02_01050 [Gemmataceae bacterium]|nr:hypothetical protein [Gemmataceae bacterium]
MFARFFPIRSLRAKTVGRNHRGFRPRLEALETRLVPANVAWTSPAGGEFLDAGNWTDVYTGAHYVPGPGDNATISLPDSELITVSGSATVGSLHAHPHMEIRAGGSLTILNSTGGSGSVTYNGIDIDAGTTLELGGGNLQTGRVSKLAGTVIADAGTTLELGGSGYLGDMTEMQQGAVLTGAGQFLLGTSDTLYNDPDAPFTLPDNFLNDAGYLVANAPITAGAHFTLQRTLRGSADFIVPAGSTMDWNSGTLEGTGQTIIQPGGTLNLNPVLGKTADRPLSNHGTVHGHDGFSATKTFVFTNETDGTFNIEADVNFLGGGGSDSGTFDNAGTVAKIGGTGVTGFRGAFNNTGLAEAAVGTLQVGSNGTSSGTFQADDAGTLEFLNHTLTAGAALTGPGLFRIRNAVTADTDLTVGRLELSSPDSGPAVTVSDTLTVTNTLNFLRGSFGGGGRIIIPQGANLNVTDGAGGGGKGFADVALDNFGTATFTDAVGDSAQFVFTNEPTGTVVVDVSNNPQVGFGRFSNQGNFLKVGPGSVRLDAKTFSNDGGYVGLHEGTLYFYGAYVQTDGITEMSDGTTLWADGSVNVQGGSLIGSGTIIGNVTNNGTIEVGGAGATGILHIQGNYTQTAAGTLSLALGGTDAGSGYGQLDITGQANLNGSLVVSFLPNYTPNPDDLFAIMAFRSRQGDFSSMQLPDGISASYSATALMLSTS